MARASSDRTSDPALCTCANLRMATRTVTQVYDQALAPAGIKTTQFALMTTLERLGQTPLTRLAERMAMDRTTLTRNLKPLIDKGFIDTSSGNDRRVRWLRVSKQGAAALTSARPLWQDVQARMVSGLGAKRWQTLLDDLAIAVSVAGPD